VHHAVPLDHLWVWLNAQRRCLEIGNRVAADARVAQPSDLVPLPRQLKSDPDDVDWGWEATLALDADLPAIRLRLDRRLVDPRFQALLHPLITDRQAAKLLSVIGALGGPLDIFEDADFKRARPAVTGEDAILPSAWDSVVDLVELFLGSDKILCLLHGAAMDVDGRRFLFLGQSGAGKSVFCARLASCGARYISDDTIIIERNGAALIRWPASPSFKTGAWPVLARDIPDLEYAEMYAKGEETVRFWREAPFVQTGRSARPSGIVFLRYKPNSPTRCVPLSLDEAMLRLKFTQAWIPPENLFSAVAFFREMPIYAMVYSDFEEAVARLESLDEAAMPPNTN
jgi:hypothetical protein